MPVTEETRSVFEVRLALKEIYAYSKAATAACGLTEGQDVRLLVFAYSYRAKSAYERLCPKFARRSSKAATAAPEETRNVFKVRLALKSIYVYVAFYKYVMYYIIIF